MKKLYNNSYLVISLYLLFSFFIDILTNLTINHSFSIGMILRGILFVYLIVGLLFKYKNKNNYITIATLGVYSGIFLLINHNQLSIINLFKYNFVIILMLFLYNLYKNEDKKINRNMLTLSLLFYSFSIIIAWLTKTAIDSYAVAKVGTVGWFNSANEISAIISIIIAYIFVNLQKRINIIEIIAIVTSLFAAILIGTRLPLIIFLICVLYIFIKKLIRDIKCKNINYTNIIIFLLFIIAFIIKFKETPLWKNFVIHVKYLKLENPLEVFTSFKLFDHFVFNRRLTFLKNANKLIKKSCLSNKLFGLGFLKKYVEMDMFDIFYVFGLIGFIILVIAILFIIKNLRNRKDIYYLPIFIILITSLLSGHVILSPNVSLIASVVIVNTYYKKRRKKVLLASYDLNTGGIETALVNLIKKLDSSNYDITLYLEKKDGYLLNELSKSVKVKQQKVFSTKLRIFNKSFNILNKIKFLITNFKEYDFGCCYATYSLSSNFLARYASNNSCIYIHSDYTKVYENDINKINGFFKDRKLDKFKHIVFVSNESKENLISIYPRFSDKSKVINNFIDNERYLKLSEEKIKETKPKGKKLFLFVGRIDESSKNLTRLINSFNQAIKQNSKVELWIVGSGPDEKMVKELIEELKLEKNVKMLGLKSNPYPYYKLCDYVVLTSNYEGFPVVYGEAITFKKKIITTIDVSDEFIKIPNNFGYICKKNEKDISSTIFKVSTHDTLKYKTVDIDKANENKLSELKKLIND